MKHLLLAAVLLIISPSPLAAAKPTVPCWKIIAYVAAYGRDAVESWARSQGYTDAEIAAIRQRCFKL